MCACVYIFSFLTFSTSLHLFLPSVIFLRQKKSSKEAFRELLSPHSFIHSFIHLPLTQTLCLGLRLKCASAMQMNAKPSACVPPKSSFSTRISFERNLPLPTSSPGFPSLDLSFYVQTCSWYVFHIKANSLTSSPPTGSFLSALVPYAGRQPYELEMFRG